MAKFGQFEGVFNWFFIELETHFVECDICFIPTTQRPNCAYNKGYIAYFYCTCAKRPYFHFRSKIWRHHRVSRSRFPIRRWNFVDCAINKPILCICLLHARNVHISASHLRTCLVDYFFIGKAKSPQYFCFRFIWRTDHVLSHPRWSFSPSFKLMRLPIAKLRRCWCGYVTWPCDLDLWPFDLGQWSNMAGHVVNPSTKLRSYAYPFLTYELWCPP